jgi:hypothetical protein
MIKQALVTSWEAGFLIVLELSFKGLVKYLAIHAKCLPILFFFGRQLMMTLAIFSSTCWFLMARGEDLDVIGRWLVQLFHLIIPTRRDFFCCPWKVESAIRSWNAESIN